MKLNMKIWATALTCFLIFLVVYSVYVAVQVHVMHAEVARLASYKGSGR